MSSKSVTFFSAIGRDFKSASQFAAEAHAIPGHEADSGNIFGIGEGRLPALLRLRIDASTGVVQMVREPPFFTLIEAGGGLEETKRASASLR